MSSVSNFAIIPCENDKLHFTRTMLKIDTSRTSSFDSNDGTFPRSPYIRTGSGPKSPQSPTGKFLSDLPWRPTSPSDRDVEDYKSLSLLKRTHGIPADRLSSV